MNSWCRTTYHAAAFQLAYPGIRQVCVCGGGGGGGVSLMAPTEFCLKQAGELVWLGEGVEWSVTVKPYTFYSKLKI